MRTAYADDIAHNDEGPLLTELWLLDGQPSSARWPIRSSACREVEAYEHSDQPLDETLAHLGDRQKRVLFVGPEPELARLGSRPS